MKLGKGMVSRDRPRLAGKHARSRLKMLDVGKFLGSKVRTPERGRVVGIVRDLAGVREAECRGMTRQKRHVASAGIPSHVGLHTEERRHPSNPL